jgi:hypothetical protein
VDLNRDPVRSIHWILDRSGPVRSIEVPANV